MEESNQSLPMAMADGVVTYNAALKRYVCTICNVPLSGGTDVGNHLEGSKHREAGARYAVSRPREAPRSLQDLLTPCVLEAAVGGIVAVTPTKAFECLLCSVQLSGLVPLKSHLVSEVHTKKVEGQRPTGSVVSKFAPMSGLPVSLAGVQTPVTAQKPPVFQAAAKTQEISGFHTPTDVQGFSVAQTPTAVQGVSVIQSQTKFQDVSRVPHLSAIQCSSNFLTSLPAKGNSSFTGHTPVASKFQITDEEIKKYAEIIGIEPNSRGFSVASSQTEAENELEKAFREMLVIQTDNIAEPFSCTACQKRFNSSYTLSDHLKSKKHKKKEMELDLQSRKTNEKENPSISEKNVSKCRSSRQYSVLSVPRGHVYVFNNTFDGQGKSQRTGAQFDSLNILETFRKMGYDVFTLEDLTGAQTLEAFKNIRGNAELNGVDALIIFILSHGVDPYTFRANDGQEISLHNIRFSFTDRGCPYMKGKPKIFFTNYCRGEQMEKREVDSVEVPSDMVTIHAAIEGVMAHRLKSVGTVFVKCLCEVLNRHARKMELRELYSELGDQMKQNKGTRPMWEDYGFEKFFFNPV
ncbi:caspase-2-like isoform X2 [Penaeus japonicus]|uniref:caspase-2-like isoform X2 n=1 Tax=Penaeus japonicus TaxID=27405 RepID=UPI001C70E500|nr:caspase-2-like isoform X2 [Penaeus japonicus]